MYIRSEGQNDAGDLVQLKIIMRKNSLDSGEQSITRFPSSVDLMFILR